MKPGGSFIERPNPIEPDSDIWKIIAIFMVIIFGILSCYMVGTLGSIRTELQAMHDTIRSIEKTQDWNNGIVTENQRKILNILEKQRLTPDELEELRKEVLKK